MKLKAGIIILLIILVLCAFGFKKITIKSQLITIEAEK